MFHRRVGYLRPRDESAGRGFDHQVLVGHLAYEGGSYDTAVECGSLVVEKEGGLVEWLVGSDLGLDLFSLAA